MMKTPGDDPSMRPSPCPINWCDYPPWVIASPDFNLYPLPLAIAGVYQANRSFFERLETLQSPQARSRAFHEYQCVRFELHHWNEYCGLARNSLRNSYIRFLQGWQRDSNGSEGAVLKSWVESRFGIPPTFHRRKLRSGSSEEDMTFAIDRMKGSSRTNAIYSQLDLLFHFCQYEIAKRFPGQSTLTLYRGTNDVEEHPIVEAQGGFTSCVRLNNTVSFTSDPERAWEFGSTVWKTTAALSKVICFSGLVEGSLLSGESEFILIGGNYQVERLRF